VWSGALLLSLLFVGVWEGSWRVRGFTPSLNDDAGLWALTRAKGSTRARESIILIGGSRMQVGFNLDACAQKTGVRPIQLAIDGNSPIPVLRHLANDQSFRGIIISDFMEEYLRALVDPAAAQEVGVPEQWIKQYEERSIFSVFEWRMGALVQGTFVYRVPDLSPRNVIGSLRRGQLPSPSYAVVDAERSRRADYSKLDIEEHRKRRQEIVREEYARTPRLSVPEFTEGAKRLRELVERIRSRGGDVIFVRFPTTGMHWEMDNQRYPKSEYWDGVAAQTKLTMIHFKDYPSLSAFDCPDESHLDYRDTGRFTDALLEILDRNMPLKNSKGPLTRRD